MLQYDICKNCHYSIKMKNGWICGEYAASIEPTNKMCNKGVKRFDVSEISMAEMDSTIQQVDMPSPVQPMPIS